MDYKKDCEERLRKYAKADEMLEILNKRLQKASMHGKPSDISAIDFSKIGHSNMSKDALDELIEVQHILKQIHNIESEKEIIDNVLDKIKKKNKEEYKFIELRYLNGNTLEETARVLGYSSNSKHTIYSIQNRTLKKFAMYYWGE